MGKARLVTFTRFFSSSQDSSLRVPTFFFFCSSQQAGTDGRHPTYQIERMYSVGVASDVSIELTFFLLTFLNFKLKASFFQRNAGPP
ncbi:transmembrane protein, putative [Bodo saltans]|uniref:Transmembrane protein, putative n=1 Tax=Bodo saltans TaxID=75058 RepID=A0A0S4JRD2_BODSA|nr:transmembrane protein, putative [Bodo saltans]|eukprot:CUG94099.1 transmembrane protein, putative [Bodo saltans]